MALPVSKDENYLCPQCAGLDIRIGQCANCGWETSWRVEWRDRQNTGTRGGRGRRRRKRSTIDSPFMSSVPEMPKCPACGGRGWGADPMTACYFCLGHGTVSPRDYQMATAKKEDEE